MAGTGEVQGREPDPAQAAAETVQRRTFAQSVDVEICAREPIHLAGSVQAHAALVAADLRGRRVVACSANTAEILGVRPPDLLGAELSRILPADLMEELAASSAEAPTQASLWRGVRLLGPERGPFAVQAHRWADRLFIELEPAPVEGPEARLAGATGRTLAQLRSVPDLQSAAQVAADGLRALTGYQRVLIYRFDRDCNGAAIAEARDPEAFESLLGLHFPASDIPAQARALYRVAPPRFVLDRDRPASPLFGEGSGGDAPLDLTFVAARSLSPIHLEYQKNLGVNGSMSASIVIGGNLWGLVIGHHRQPHPLPPQARWAAGELSEALAMRIGELELARAWTRQERHLAAETALLGRMAAGDDLAEALLGGEPGLADLFEAGGAAVVDEQGVRSTGTAPPAHAIEALADWLRDRPPGRVHAFEQLAAEFPPAGAYAAQASGLLAAFTTDDRRRLLLWFKPEQIASVAWGGDPNKAVAGGDGRSPILPRRSFERWVEERRGVAEPWAEWQEAAAERIAGAVEGVALRQNRRITALGAQQAELMAAVAEQERLLAQKDILTREIDHRVKNSLQIVASFVGMQGRAAKDPEARAAFHETYGRIMSVARIHQSLYDSEDMTEVDLGQTIQALCRDLSGVAGEGRTLDVSVAPDLKLPYQSALAWSLIATELVTNALKYAYEPGERGSVRVDVRSGDDSTVCLSVSDAGRGLPPDWASAPQQSGLGMKLIRAMLAQIDGRMQVENEGGARFVVCA